MVYITHLTNSALNLSIDACNLWNHIASKYVDNYNNLQLMLKKKHTKKLLYLYDPTKH